MTTGRLGPWEPQNAADKLDRLDSLAQIQQLPVRYGQAVDARDMDALVALFVPDVRVGRDLTGRAALRDWFSHTLREPRTSIHFVMNHVVDFADADHATGVVYCRDELEFPEVGEWRVGTIQYWDTYVRVDGLWCFERRTFNRWYLVDALDRPGPGKLADQERTLGTGQLPDVYPTWQQFWAEDVS